MIRMRSIVESADNSGAKIVECITILGTKKRDSGRIADIISGSVKEAIPRANVKKKEVVRAVIVRTRKETRRKDGSYIRFDDNAGVVIDKQGMPLGTRVLGPIAREVKEAGFHKIASLCKEVV